MKGDIERVAWIVIIGIMCINVLNVFLGILASNYTLNKVQQNQTGYYNYYNPNNQFYNN